MNGRERIMAMIEGMPVDSLPLMPITMMFASDQIGAMFREYATDYRVLCEGQLRTAEKFDFDYVNTMSDPACESADCGAAVKFFPDQPPALDDNDSLLADKSKLVRLKIPDSLTSPRMSNRLRALQWYGDRVRGEKLIEGWIEGPCAQGADLRGINVLMTDFFDDPKFVTDLFEYILELELRFARAQVEVGAESIGIGDAAASLVGPKIYEEFVWPYEKKMVDGLHAMGVKVHLHICGNTRQILKGMGKLGCDIVDLDFMVPVSEARVAMGPNQVLLGNIDPVRALRNSNPKDITAAIDECHHQAGTRYVVGAGCEVPRDTAEANVSALTAYARSHSNDNSNRRRKEES